MVQTNGERGRDLHDERRIGDRLRPFPDLDPVLPKQILGADVWVAKGMVGLIHQRGILLGVFLLFGRGGPELVGMQLLLQSLVSGFERLFLHKK